MIYRIDELTENQINPTTNSAYDSSWLILSLSNSTNYAILSGVNNGCAYSIKISKVLHNNWKLAVGDFIEHCDSNSLNGILVISQHEYDEVISNYNDHHFNETVLRDYETSVLVHSTTMENWINIQHDGMLKSWNKLKLENTDFENQPIGIQLGDPINFSDYIMFGGGVTGEIVVNSKQSGKIVMDIDAEYKTGARLYFDARKMAKDGLLIRDGAHIKVKDKLPLEPYLIYSATWDKVGLPNQISTPKIFAELSDQSFKEFVNNK